MAEKKTTKSAEAKPAAKGAAAVPAKQTAARTKKAQRAAAKAGTPPKSLNPYSTAKPFATYMPSGKGEIPRQWHLVDARGLMGQEVKLVAIRAHMHLRGKSMEVRAVYPTGETEILLSVPKYDFNWQPYYYLETPKVLPNGTRIEITSLLR